MFPVLMAAGFFSEWASAWIDNYGGLVLVIVGMVLIVVEMLIPGFGVAGISGGIALLAGLIIGSPSFPAAMFSLLIIVFLLAVIAVIIFRSALKGKLSRSPVVLNTAISSESSVRADAEAQQLVGKRGKTLTALRPAGIASIDGKRLDVSSEAEFIDRDAEIEVVSVDGMKILVKRV